MPEHWLTFLYQYGIGGIFFTFTVLVAIQTGVLNLRIRNGKIVFSLIVDGFLLFMTFHALWIYLVTANYLFKMDEHNIKELDESKISQEVFASFEKNGYKISPKSKVSILKEGKTWTIQDDDLYNIKKDENPYQKEYLFFTDKKHVEELNKKVVPSEIKKLLLEKSCITLSEQCEFIEINQNKWSFLDKQNKQTYQIMYISSLDALNVYRTCPYSLYVYGEKNNKNVVLSFFAIIFLILAAHITWTYTRKS